MRLSVSAIMASSGTPWPIRYSRPTAPSEYSSPPAPPRVMISGCLLYTSVIVSDGTHLFRIHEICAADGLNVLTSPRPRVAVESEDNLVVGEFERLEHEILSYTLWRMHLH